MTDTLLLKDKIEESGFKLKYIAQKLGITYQCLLKKINNETEFKAAEIQQLCQLLNIDIQLKELIFFAPIVDKTSTTA